MSLDEREAPNARVSSEAKSAHYDSPVNRRVNPVVAPFPPFLSAHNSCIHNRRKQNDQTRGSGDF